MIDLFNKRNLSLPEQAEWFAKYTIYVLYEKINARRDYISSIKAFYNSSIQSCILRITFDEKCHTNSKEPLYLMLDYTTKEMSNSGRHFESSISDKDKYINWIQNNEILEFYPDNNIMSILTKKL